MARSIDVALTLLEKAIERGKIDSDYYIDNVKLHKLLYLGQCFYRFCYDKDLFEDKIIAIEDGPYVEGLNFVVGLCGFDKIKNVDDLREKVYLFPISPSRDEVCELLLDKFGKYTTDELVLITKKTSAYQKCYGCCNYFIGNELMKKTGEYFLSKTGYKVKVKV